MHQDTLDAFLEKLHSDMASVTEEMRDERLDEHIEVIIGGLMMFMLESIRRAQTKLETGEKDAGNFISSFGKKSSEGPLETDAVNRFPAKIIEKRFED
jgi:hypothetical protein